MRETRAYRSRVCVQGDMLDFIACDVIRRFTAGYVFAGELPALGGARWTTREIQEEVNKRINIFLLFAFMPGELS